MYRISILALLIAAGCATPTYQPVTSFAIEPKIDVPQATPTGDTLGVRPLEYGRPYRQPIAYRDKGLILGSFDKYHWAELPRDTGTRALVDAITATRRFQDVGHAALMSRPNLLLTGQLRKFDLDKTGDPWKAQVEISLSLRPALESNVVWSGVLDGTAPLATNDIAALPEAMSQAVANIATQAATAIAAAQLPPQK
ncbi:MAG: ABC-type transport auxiliary lipoprotein family protein [Candidatus Hydrogenedentes bacterium]|nr:ABC-type transport auxiliary lipoprotein family protein [Candidatus Hydrogenedentota bacterium]